MISSLKKEYNKNIYMAMPSNISYMWNMGSLLGMCLLLQLITGIFLTMHFVSDSSLAFESVNHINRDVMEGWLIRSYHANGASLFFLLVYLHLGRGLYYYSFSLKYVWWVGCLILLFLFMIAFIGYVLPWGQMSFWGATVITNLVTAIPYIGESIVIWIWGGFSVGAATLTRFYTFHFLFPFLLVVLVIIHILFLHISGSSNPLNLNSNLDKISFMGYYVWKDIFGLFVLMLIFSILIYNFPYSLMDPDNFMVANSLVTPVHIQPEWYFLFAYAILRCIPSKLGGVLALMMSILIYGVLPLLNKVQISLSYNLIFKLYFWIWLGNFFSLIIMGAMPVEEPFIYLAQEFSIIYFLFFCIFLI